MTDYQLLGETLHREWRPAGETTWLGLTFDQRAFWQGVAVAADSVWQVPEPEEFYCDDCYDNAIKIEDLEDEVFALTERLKKAEM